jgi:peptidoglycan/LPS O-acetylase OafA/YrhL
LLYRNHAQFLWLHPHVARSVEFLDALLILHYAYAFLIGIMLYRTWRDGHRIYYWAVIGACLLYSSLFEPHVDFALTLLFLAMVYAGSHGLLRFLENRAVLFLGFISYTLYLTHQNIGYVVIRWAERHGWNANLAIGLAILVALGIATALAYGVERPALRLMRGKRST